MRWARGDGFNANLAATFVPPDPTPYGVTPQPSVRQSQDEAAQTARPSLMPQERIRALELECVQLKAELAQILASKAQKSNGKAAHGAKQRDVPTKTV